MTHRERLVATSRGGEVDRKATVAMPGVRDEKADAIVGSAVGFFESDQAYLVAVDGIMATLKSTEPGIFGELEEDPEGGDRKLQQVADQVRLGCEKGLEVGADGIFYVIRGANPTDATPMEYGGHILELDRMILDEISEARFNLVFVEDEDEPYMDFLSDLPCQALGWKKSSGVSLESVREMRQGALAMDDMDADLILMTEALAMNGPTRLEANA